MDASSIWWWSHHNFPPSFAFRNSPRSWNFRSNTWRLSDKNEFAIRYGSFVYLIMRGSAALLNFITDVMHSYVWGYRPIAEYRLQIDPQLSWADRERLETKTFSRPRLTVLTRPIDCNKSLLDLAALLSFWIDLKLQGLSLNSFIWLHIWLLTKTMTVQIKFSSPETLKQQIYKDEGCQVNGGWGGDRTLKS